jgi:hypothetical protein
VRACVRARARVRIVVEVWGGRENGNLAGPVVASCRPDLRLLRMVIKLAPSGVPSMTCTRAGIELLVAEKREA